MKYLLKNLRALTLHFTAIGMVLFAGQAMAQAASAIDATAAQAYSISELQSRYPENSIQSSEAAASALAEVKEAHANIEARHEADRRACYPKFFATACLNKATERRRVDLSKVRQIEIEANAYIRQAKVVERDRKLVEKAAKDGTVAPSGRVPMSTVIDAEQAATNAAAKEAQRKARAEASAKKLATHAEKQQRQQERDSANAQQRAENIEKYEAKVRQSEARQKEISRKKAEKELKRHDKKGNSEGNSETSGS